jgi:hypothetical protein
VNSLLRERRSRASRHASRVAKLCVDISLHCHVSDALIASVPYGHRSTVQRIECTDEKQAVQKAQQLVDRQDGELWDSDHLIVRFPDAAVHWMPDRFARTSIPTYCSAKYPARSLSFWVSCKFPCPGAL